MENNVSGKIPRASTQFPWRGSFFKDGVLSRREFQVEFENEFEMITLNLLESFQGVLSGPDPLSLRRQLFTKIEFWANISFEF